jgi:predicted transcriptional regulator
MAPDSFTPREMDVLSILWDLGSATVAEVRDRMPADLAYTTVLSLMQTLEEKGMVRHEEEGRAYRYFPLLDWEDVGKGELRRLLRKVFKGSPELLVLHLLDDRTVDQEELRRMRRLLDERLGESGQEES